MVESEQAVVAVKHVKRKKKQPQPKVQPVKKTCCGKKKCTCNPAKEEIKPCDGSILPVAAEQTCICGKIGCECYGKMTAKVPAPKLMEIYKCDYPGDDDYRPVCVCGRSDCNCYDRAHLKPHLRLHGQSDKQEKIIRTHDLQPPCVCGKPYCVCRKLKTPADIPDIKLWYPDTCSSKVSPPLKNFCVCQKPDCTCYATNKIVDDERECTYRVPLVRPLCICGKIDCDCNIERIGEKKLQKKILVPDAPARCICGKIFCECNIGRATISLKEIKTTPDEEIKIELEKSNYVKGREQLMKSLEVPSLNEAKKNLGELASFVYERCEAGLRTYIPTVPEMPYGDLWVSPSDLLIPHVGLKAPLTRKHMQALTHEGILDIGYHIELKFINQMEIEKEEALQAQKQEITQHFQDNMKQMIKDAEAKEKAACRREIKKINDNFETKLMEEIHAMQLKLTKEFKNFSDHHDAKLNKKWEVKLKISAEETTKNLTRKFLEELSRQEKILILHFKSELIKKDILKHHEFEKLKVEHNKELQDATHRLECKNLANMMYVLCMERRKCVEEKTAIEEFYKKKMRRLNKRIEKHTDNIEQLKEEIDHQIKEVQLRETCLLEILKQYQKFINFALKAVPTQAEFLLSIEKLMMLELTDALVQLKPPSKTNVRPCDFTLPWPHMSPSEELEVVNENALIIEEYHHCLNELAVPKKKEDMVLPAVILNEKLYVREDFRNMMSRGLKPSPSEVLWNDDVDWLMDTLRQSVSDNTDTDVQSCSSSDIPGKKILKDNNNKNSAIQFKLSNSSEMLKLPSHDDVSSLKERTDTKTSLKYSIKPSPVDYSKVGVIETNPYLLGTESSLELFSKKHKIPRKKYDRECPAPDIPDHSDIKPVMQNEDFVFVEKLDLICKSKEILDPEEKSIETLKRTSVGQQSAVSDGMAINPVETKDSLILRHSSMIRTRKGFSISPNDSIELKKESLIHSVERQKSSRLVAAKDSVEMLRKSRSLLNEPAVCTICHKKDIKEKESIPKECEKCKYKESLEVLSGGIINKKHKVEDNDTSKQLKLSHVEIISVKENLKTSVAFDPKHTSVKDSKLEVPEKLSQMYKPHTKPKAKKKKPVQNLCQQHVENKVKILGERKGVEYLQTNEEFTVDRMRSFISLISEHPTLIKLFTACQR